MNKEDVWQGAALAHWEKAKLPPSRSWVQYLGPTPYPFTPYLKKMCGSKREGGREKGGRGGIKSVPEKKKWDNKRSPLSFYYNLLADFNYLHLTYKKKYSVKMSLPLFTCLCNSHPTLHQYNINRHYQILNSFDSYKKNCTTDWQIFMRYDTKDPMFFFICFLTIRNRKTVDA